jgi:hypothetical protein
MRVSCVASAVTVALTLAVAPAAAGPCCHAAPLVYAVPVAPVVQWPDEVRRIYVVNQGPVLSGPGIYTYTNEYVPSFVPPHYAVGRYVFPPPDARDVSAYPYVWGARYRHCPGCGGFAPVHAQIYRDFGHAPYRYRAALRSRGY